MVIAYIATMFILWCLTVWYCRLKSQYDRLSRSGRLTRYRDRTVTIIGTVRTVLGVLIIATVAYSAEPVVGIGIICIVGLAVGFNIWLIRSSVKAARPTNA